MDIPKLSPNDTTFVNVVSTYVLPVVSGLNVWVNVINIVVLSRSIFRGSVYKYLMFNSLFDALTLSMIALKPTLKTVLTEHINEDYIYVYLTSCFLMCSDLSTIAALFERIVKLGGGLHARNVVLVGKKKKHPYRLVIVLIVLFSACVNSPVLYTHAYFEIEWFYKNVYFELCLTQYGWSQFWGIFAYVTNMIVNLGIFILAIFFNSSIYKLIQKNSKKLKQFIELETAKSGEFIINIVHDVDDLHDYEDDDMDEIELEREISHHSTGKSNSKSPTKTRVRFQSAVEPPSGDLNTMESVASTTSKPQQAYNPVEMEAIRKKLCDLVVLNSHIYMLGHAPFMFVNMLQKIVNLIATSNYMDSDNAPIAFFQALANFALYASLGLTFFLHLVYNVKFRYVIKKAWRRLCCCAKCPTSVTNACGALADGGGGGGGGDATTKSTVKAEEKIV